MRSCILAVFAILCLAVTASAEVKIGIVDMKTVIAKSEPGAKAMGSLQSQFKDMKENLDAQKNSLDAMRTELQKQSMMLSQEAKLDKEAQYTRKVRDFQDMGQNYQRKLQQAEETLSKPILEKLQTILKDYGKRNGFTVILDKLTSGQVYYADSIDITNDIISELNKAMR